MAPEVFLCLGRYRPSADVFSLALLCSEILTKDLPLADIEQPGKGGYCAILRGLDNELSSCILRSFTLIVVTFFFFFNSNGSLCDGS